MRLWVSEDRTVLMRTYDETDGTGGETVVEVATRETPDGVWGPPRRLTEETSR